MTAYTAYGTPGSVARRAYDVEAQRRCQARKRGELPPIVRIADDLYANAEWVGECLEWMRARLPRGYGRLRRNGRMQQATRVSLEMKLGRPLAPDTMACHTCDNPVCIRPEHLFEGTGEDNMRDMTSKGRAGWQARERYLQAIRSTRNMEAA